MAPVEQRIDLSYLPVATFSSHITLATLLTLLLTRTIYRSYLALPASQGTRHRQPSRRTDVRIFSALSLLSLLVAGYWAYSFSTLSYKVWAAERGIELPESTFGDQGAFRGGEHPGRLQITRWLNDTPIYQDALEVVAEKARRFWWGQQINLATVAWSLLVGIEGNRRKIPHLWAFMLLAQIVSLSFAQNLFYVAVLLTPVPLPRNIRDLTNSAVPMSSSAFHRFRNRVKRSIVLAKPDNWCPHPALYLLSLISSFAAIFLIPFASNTPSFMVVTIFSRVLSFVPLLLPYFVPESFGTVHIHPHDAHSAYTTLFKTISIASSLLHTKSTGLALFSNTPDSHYHRHSIWHPFTQEHRSVMERSSTAVSRVLGAIGDHPAISAVGWDVLLSGLSVGLWAACRGLDVPEVLSATGVWFGAKPKPVTKAIEAGTGYIADDKLDAVATPARRRRTKKKETTESQDEKGTVNKRRGRPRKGEATYGDRAYVPDEVVFDEGDEDQEEDWEVGALAWGLIAATGLGSASAGVFGAETTAR